MPNPNPRPIIFNNVGSLFLKIGITFVILSLSGNMPIFMTWLITKVKDLMIAGSISLKQF